MAASVAVPSAGSHSAQPSAATAVQVLMAKKTKPIEAIVPVSMHAACRADVRCAHHACLHSRYIPRVLPPRRLSSPICQRAAVGTRAAVLRPRPISVFSVGQATPTRIKPTQAAGWRRVASHCQRMVRRTDMLRCAIAGATLQWRLLGVFSRQALTGMGCGLICLPSTHKG